MAVYVYSEQQIETMVSNARRFRIRFCVVAFVVLAITGLLAFYRPDFPILHEPVRGWLIALLVALALHPLAKSVWRWRSWPGLMRNSLRENRVEITSSTVGVCGPFGYKRQLSSRDVVRAEEPYLGRGLYLRTSNRYRWILIPRKLDGYEAIKRELAVAGAVVVQRSIPPNWEEFLFVLLFIGTILCSFLTHNIWVLSVNLLVSLLLSFGGLFVINANPDLERRRIRSARLGVFIPVAFAAVGLWLALRG